MKTCNVLKGAFSERPNYDEGVIRSDLRFKFLHGDGIVHKAPSSSRTHYPRDRDSENGDRLSYPCVVVCHCMGNSIVSISSPLLNKTMQLTS
jgi:hypothetical protein